MTKREKGRPSFKGTIHTWKVPSDIEFIYKQLGVQYLWDAVRKQYKMESITRFTIKPLPNLEWQVADNLNKITLSFKEGQFNDKQTVDTDAFSGDPTAVATIMREIGDWVSQNYMYLAVCNVLARASAIGSLDAEDMFAVVRAFNGHLFEDNDPIPAKTTLYTEVADSYAYIYTDEEGRPTLHVLDELNDAEAKEIVTLARSFWERGQSFATWWDDLNSWAEAIDEE